MVMIKRFKSIAPLILILLLLSVFGCSNSHSQKPNNSPSPTPPSEVESKIQEIQNSPYYQYVLPLKEKVVGKTVIKTISGTSGFILCFSDSNWVAVYLENMQLHWQIGTENSYEGLSGFLNSPEYGNGFEPIPINKMYANENCDINKEIANAIGKRIETLSFGLNCFNFCFPEGMELDTSIVPTNEGKYALRVFWEQW